VFIDRAKVHLRTGDREAVGKALSKALQAVDTMYQGPKAGGLLLDIAKIYGEIGKNEKALKAADRSLQIAMELAPHRIRASLLRRVAEAQATQGRPEKALSTAQLIEKEPHRVYAYLDIAMAHGNAGRKDTALRLIDKARESANEIDDNFSRVFALKSIAKAQIQVGEKQGAGLTLEQAVQSALKIRKMTQRIGQLNYVAISQAKLKYKEASLRTIAKARQEVEGFKFNHASSQMEFYNQVAKVQAYAGRNQMAVQNLVQSLRIAKKFYTENLAESLLQRLLTDYANSLGLGELSTALSKAFAEALSKSPDSDTNRVIKNAEIALFGGSFFELYEVATLIDTSNN
jgi:tetratricopeptide (TPR) repeat protein